MSTSRIGNLFSGIILLGGLYLVVLSWEGLDGRSPAYTDPRLLAEGSAGAARWTVVQVAEPSGDCLHLRRQGTLVERSCQESSLLDDYRVQIRVLRGTAAPLIFGVLPEGAARAEIALEDRTVRADPDREMAPVQVRTFGDAGRYVAGPAPARWAGSDLMTGDTMTVTIELYDDQGGRLTPQRPR